MVGFECSEAHGHTFILFNVLEEFCFLVITRNQSDVYGRNLVEIDPTSLPDLFKQLRDLNDSKKTEKNEIQNLEEKNTCFLVICLKGFRELLSSSLPHLS